MKTISIGKQDFASLREHNCFYIDKTDFIKEWWNSQDDVTLITRPRRFGKTLNMSMVECFFSVKYAKRLDLFEGLSIEKNADLRKLQGTYPVLFLSFAAVKTNTYENARRQICSLIASLYDENMYLLNGDTLNKREKKRFQAVTPRDDGVLSAMLLGEKGDLDAEIKSLYQRAGIAHVLAISGLHISLLGMGLYRLLRKRLHTRYVTAALATTVFLISYAVLSGNGVSTQRAVGMCLIYLFADVTGYAYDMLNALGIVVLVLLWENPFLLSYSAVW